MSDKFAVPKVLTCLEDLQTYSDRLSQGLQEGRIDLLTWEMNLDAANQSYMQHLKASALSKATRLSDSCCESPEMKIHEKKRVKS